MLSLFWLSYLNSEKLNETEFFGVLFLYTSIIIGIVYKFSSILPQVLSKTDEYSPVFQENLAR